MEHEYYRYDKEQLLKAPNITLICRPDNETVFREMARQMAEEIKLHNSKNEKTVIICPVGPVGQYPYFVELVNTEQISLKQVWFINMDEYLDDRGAWLPKEHLLSFRGFMERNVYEKIKPELVMPEEQRIFPDPDHLLQIPALIERLGGVDIAFGGIGINGHVAFNEADQTLTPDEFMQQKTRKLTIAPETRAANAIGDFNGALEDMPQECVTVGIYEIAQARKIRLSVFRNWHRAVVRRAAYGEVSTAFPVTLLRGHPDLTITLTEYVAGLGV